MSHISTKPTIGNTKLKASVAVLSTLLVASCATTEPDKITMKQAMEMPTVKENPKPTDPKPTDPKPTDPKPTDPKPTDPKPLIQNQLIQNQLIQKQLIQSRLIQSQSLVLNPSISMELCLDQLGTKLLVILKLNQKQVLLPARMKLLEVYYQKLMSIYQGKVTKMPALAMALNLMMIIPKYQPV